MARIDAWRCDNCGKEAPSPFRPHIPEGAKYTGPGRELPPPGWYVVTMVAHAPIPYHFCSPQCVAKFYTAGEGAQDGEVFSEAH